MGLLDTLGTVAAWAAKGARAIKNTAAPRLQAGGSQAGSVAQGGGLAFEYCALSPVQVKDLRGLYTSAKSMCSLLDQSDVCASLGHPGRTLEEMFENDIVRFLLYLCAEDGELTKAEVEFLNAVFNCERTVGEWTIRAIRLGVTSPAMPTDVPLSFQVLNQVGARCDIDAGEVIVPVFDRLAAALVIADGEETAEERECVAAYLALLTQHLESGETELKPPAYPIFLS